MLRTLGRRLLRIVLGLTVALLIAELVLQLAVPKDARYYVWPPHMSLDLEPRSDLLPGIDGESAFRVNSMGFRASEPPDDPCVHILALGGSTTANLYLDQKETWPALVDAELNGRQKKHRVWVANAGRSGRTTREHVLQVQYLLPHFAKFRIIVLYAGVNDFALRLRRGTEYDPHALASEDGRRHHLRRAFHFYPAWHKPLLERSQVWSRIRKLRYRFWPKEGGTVGETHIERLRNRREAPRFLEELPDMASGRGEFRRNVGRILDMARERDVTVVLMTHAYLWRADLPPELEARLWFGWSRGERKGAEYYTAGALAEGMRAYNDVLRGLARERDVPLIDLEPRVPRDGSCLYDDVHFNEHGARVVAKAVADRLLPLLERMR